MKSCLIFTFIFLLLVKGSIGQTENDKRKYLALGDSYTIGESVEFNEGFPMQLSNKLKFAGIDVDIPDIIAKTGCTTDELLEGIEENQPSQDYDLVTLLIGVNNQFRGRDLIDYKEQFEILLKKAISFAAGDETKVIVISIPDYGVTPFGQKRGNNRIAKEINQFNKVNKSISDQFGVAYVNITKISSRAVRNPDLIAEDGLHPSGEMYARWVKEILPLAENILKNQQ